MATTRKPKGLFVFYAVLSVAAVAASVYLVHKVFVGELGGDTKGAGIEVFMALTAPLIIFMLPAVLAGLRAMWQVHFSKEKLDQSRYRGMRLVRTTLKQLALVFFTYCIYLVGNTTIYMGHSLIGAVIIALSVASSLKLEKGLEFTLYKSRGLL